MAKHWWNGKEIEDKKSGEESEDEFEIKPKELKEQLEKINKVDKIEATVDELKTKTGILDEMGDFLKEYRAEKAQRKNIERAQKQESDSTELEELALTNPVEAMQRVQAPLVEAQVNTMAKMTMNELFNTDRETFEYAVDPKIKNRITELVLNMPLASRNNEISIRNAYYVAIGEKQAEIKEGKIKSALASVSSSGNGTGNTSGKSEEVVSLTDAEKKAARIFGLDEKAYADSKRELSYV